MVSCWENSFFQIKQKKIVFGFRDLVFQPKGSKFFFLLSVPSEAHKNDLCDCFFLFLFATTAPYRYGYGKGRVRHAYSLYCQTFDKNMESMVKKELKSAAS